MKISGIMRKAEAIYIKNQKIPRKDCYFVVADCFMIVAKDMNDSAPVWYNIDMIERLEGVEAGTKECTDAKIRLF